MTNPSMTDADAEILCKRTLILFLFLSLLLFALFCQSSGVIGARTNNQRRQRRPRYGSEWWWCGGGGGGDLKHVGKPPPC